MLTHLVGYGLLPFGRVQVAIIIRQSWKCIYVFNYFTIKKIIGTNPVTVVVSGGGLIEGAASKIIRNINDSLTIQATSATEYIITESHLSLQNTPSFADDAAAGVGGLIAGDRYQTDGTGAAPLNVAGLFLLKQ